MPLLAYRHGSDVGPEFIHCSVGDAHVFKHPFQLCGKLKPTFCLRVKNKEGGSITQNGGNTKGNWDLHYIHVYIRRSYLESQNHGPLCVLRHAFVA